MFGLREGLLTYQCIKTANKYIKIQLWDKTKSVLNSMTNTESEVCIKLAIGKIPIYDVIKDGIWLVKATLLLGK